MKAITILSLIAGLTLTLVAQNTTRSDLRPRAAAPAEQTASMPANDIDTLAAPPAHTVDINGYDKPLRSRRETFFVTNNGSASIQSISFTLSYFDRQGRQLHRRSVNLPIEIPAGETRQASLRSWDQQLSLYYIHSSVLARVDQATPFDVKISADTIFYRP